MIQGSKKCGREIKPAITPNIKEEINKMSLQVEKLEKNMAKLTIEVSAEELEKAIESVYQRSKKNISVPGFRKGKVPRKMIERMYGKEVFYEDAVNDLLPDAYEDALEECEEEIVSSPKIEVIQVEAGKPLIFTAEVATKPEIGLGKYKGVKIDKIDTEVTEEEVNAQVDRERENNARNIAVEDRPVKDGDMTVIDFEGFVDGVAFEGGKGEDYPLTIGSGAFIPGFEEQLVGAEIGKEVEVNVTFLVVDEGYLIVFDAVQSIRELCYLFLAGKETVDGLVPVAAALRMLVEPPGVDVLAEHPGKVALQGDDAVADIVEAHGVPVESVLQVGAAVLFGYEHLAPKAEGVLHLPLGHAATGLTVVVDTGGCQEVHLAAVQDGQGGGGSSAVVEVGAAVGAVEGTYHLSGIAGL